MCRRIPIAYNHFGILSITKCATIDCRQTTRKTTANVVGGTIETYINGSLRDRNITQPISHNAKVSRMPYSVSSPEKGQQEPPKGEKEKLAKQSYEEPLFFRRCLLTIVHARFVSPYCSGVE